MSFFGDLWKVGKLGAMFIPGVGPFVSGGMHLAETASKGSKGKWGLDELLATLPFAGAAGVPGLDKIPGLGGGGGSTGVNLGAGDPTLGTGGQSFGLGSIGGILKGTGKWAKDNPLAAFLIGSSVLGGGEERKLQGAQRLVEQAKARRAAELEKLREPSRLALFRMLEQPYSRSMPNFSDIFAGRS